MARRGRGVGWAAALALLAVAAAGPAEAAAQDASGLGVVIGLGHHRGGPGDGLVESLGAAGLDQTRPEECYVTVCTEAEEHPFAFDDGIGVAVLAGIRYRFAAPLSLEALLSNGVRGHAEGYNQDTYGHLVVAYAPWVFSSTLGGHVGPVRVGAGPAVLRTGWQATANSTRVENSRTVSVGGAAGASVDVALPSVVLSVRAEWRTFPSATVDNPDRLALEASYNELIAGVTILANPN
jgi:hypothetical protein